MLKSLMIGALGLVMLMAVAPAWGQGSGHRNPQWQNGNQHRNHQIHQQSRNHQWNQRSNQQKHQRTQLRSNHHPYNNYQPAHQRHAIRPQITLKTQVRHHQNRHTSRHYSPQHHYYSAPHYYTQRQHYYSRPYASGHVVITHPVAPLFFLGGLFLGLAAH